LANSASKQASRQKSYSGGRRSAIATRIVFRHTPTQRMGTLYYHLNDA